MAPRNQRLHRAYSSRPTASRSRPRGASSSPRNRPNSANAALAASALRARSSRERALGVQAVDQLPEQVGPAVLAGPPADLRGHLAELAAGGHLAAVRGLQQRLAVLRQGLRHGREPGADVALGLLAVGGHQVEDAAHVLHRSGGDRDLAGDDARVVHLDLQAEALDERLLGDPLALVDRRRRADAGQDLPVQLGPLGETGGREVGQPVVVAGDAGVRRHHRVEGGGFFDVAVGQGVDRAFGAHAVTLGEGSDAIRQRSSG